jgi:hypothetical protein
VFASRKLWALGLNNLVDAEEPGLDCMLRFGRLEGTLKAGVVIVALLEVPAPNCNGAGLEVLVLLRLMLGDSKLGALTFNFEPKLAVRFDMLEPERSKLGAAAFISGVWIAAAALVLVKW